MGEEAKLESTLPTIEVREQGASRDGVRPALDRRLFMQLHVFTGAATPSLLVEAARQRRLESVLYRDVNDPRGVGLLTMHEDPAFFVTELRDFLNAPPFATLTHRPEFTMLGRSYATGYETDLEDWLLVRPRRTALNPAWPWAVWYPLRRSGAFARLAASEQGAIVREHSVIGHAYGTADLAHDIRLACHGLDANDNEFVIGLVGRALHPLSHIIQAMRKTRQTAEYIASMGPFFVGHALWQSPSP